MAHEATSFEMSVPLEDLDLYEVLKVERNASKDEIRKSYRKLALLHHPDKVAESDRVEADIKFKEISQAYEILYDDEKRQMYDAHGMSAFESGQGPGGTADMEEMLANLFGMGGGMGSMGGRSPRKPRKSPDEEQVYEITLEELYKGKTVRFASTKNVICSHCRGKGGKESAKSKQCTSCKGQGRCCQSKYSKSLRDSSGVRQVIQQQGPFLTQSAVSCDNCQGTGSVYSDKDRCKKCRGKKVTSERKMLELYIPHGSRNGERITLAGEADQSPDQEPGDIIFILKVKEHDIYERRGNDLVANVDITLAEALCGFSRVLIKTLDGRGLHVDHQKPAGGILKPGSTIRIQGEGMPIKRTDAKGDLFLVAAIEFPSDSHLQDKNTTEALLKLLPGSKRSIVSDSIDDVTHETKDSLDAFGEGGDQDEWEDEDEEHEHGASCAQQ